MPPALRRQNLSDRAATILKRYIIAERLEPGHRLPAERRLADWLNVSRTVLREALSQLLGEGILERPSPYVLRVADFDRARVAADLAVVANEEAEAQDLIELRVMLEIGAVEAIVARAHDGHLREIERWVIEGERRLASGEPIYRADARFHAALLRTLGNRAINDFLPLIEENLRHDLVLDPHQLTTVGSAADHRVIRQHREIYEAIRRRDVESARRWMIAHLTPYLQRDRAIPEPDATRPAALASDGDERDA
jgi:GntR family transcriptional regulator, transcriptional repressor for pyruvate dehydrogenase complex